MKFRARVVAARIHQRLGAPGLLGICLLGLAAVIFVVAWQAHQQYLSRPSVPTAIPPARSIATPARPPLPPAADIPVLLDRIQRTAVELGFGWPRADYRFNAASVEAPASLEVHCTLKGPYLNLRRFVTALLQDAPTLTLKEFALNRANANTTDVEAKLAIVIYLSSDDLQ